MLFSNDDYIPEGSTLGGGFFSRIQNDSLIEEERSFEELSSRLGDLQNQSSNFKPFDELASSVQITMKEDSLYNKSSNAETSTEFA